MRTPRLKLTLLVTALGLSLGATPALAAKPLATTDPATDISPVGANLHGSVDPRGVASSAYFQYGTTKNYGKRTPAQSAGLNPGAIPLTASVTGLKSDTTYHFRIVAENKDGKTNGKDVTFKTAAPTTTPAFSPNPVPYGDPVAVSGQIVGSGAKGAEVTLFGRAFPFTDPFVQFGNTVVADANGNYLFILASALSTAQFEVRAGTDPAFTSSIQTLQVSSKVSLYVRDKVRKGRKLRFHGIVAPGQDGIVVEIQKRKRDGSFGVFARTTLRHRSDGRSSYSVRKTLRRRGIFRAWVGSAGGVVVPGTSREHSVRVTRR
ncbi:MAG: hypothetical protein QOJ57_2714 [Thermoleophilaceae bacterium]|nr:hypothetical protein [Thermoleophilaceae bacterium]